MDADDTRSNPLMIPPPPPGTPKKLPQPPSDIGREPADTASFISIPASMLDSATLRIASTRAEQKPVVNDGADDIVFFPTPATPVPEPSLPVPELVEGPGADPTTDAPETAPTPIAPPLTWRLELPDGAVVELAASSLLGRNPTDHPAAPGATLIRVDDSTKSVSKTHALLQLDGDRLFVHDLGSTNGVYIVEPGREAVEVRPDHRVQLSDDSDLELGRFIVKVRRG